MPVEMEYGKIADTKAVRVQARMVFFERTGFDVQEYLDTVRAVQTSHNGNPVRQTHREIVMGKIARARYTHGYDI